MRAYASVDLPEPFGPITAWISFEVTRRSTPLTISVPSSASATCRLRSSRCANFVRAFLRLASRFARLLVTQSSRCPPAAHLAAERDCYAWPMPNIGPLEIVLLLLFALLLFGAKRLPEIGRSVGQGMREFKDSVIGNSKTEPTELEPPTKVESNASAATHEHDPT